MIRLLIVDDSPFIHKAVTKAVMGTGIEICGIGKNGREGVELYSAEKPDVVLMDITMPIMDGLEAAQAIMDKDRAARICMLSAMGDEELMGRAKQIGVSRFLQKPFKSPQLVETLSQMCPGGI